MIDTNNKSNNLEIFIFGASKSTDRDEANQIPLFFKKSNKEDRIFDWILSSVKELNYNSIKFIGGYYLDQIVSKYPELEYVVNPKWSQTHVVGSLRYALETWKGGEILLMYADTVYRPNCINQFLVEASGITAGVDSGWRKRIEKKEDLEDAEKIVQKENLIVRAGRKSLPPEEATAQFSGLLYFDIENARELYDLFFDKKKISKKLLSDNESLTDLLSYLIDNTNKEIKTFEVQGNWAEIDSPSDIAKFVFGTKAETLERIKPFVQYSKICDQIHFSLKEWEADSDQVINQIQIKFAGQKVIIRSSSLEEDSWDSSQAGAFLSVADVNVDDTQIIRKAIVDVTDAFRKSGSRIYNQNNQVLVQPFLKNVAMSGVAFSRHLENNTPYYLINYDDVSRRTDTVTSGNSYDSKSITVFKEGNTKPKENRLVNIIKAIEELENIIGYESLDIEFVLTENEELFIVQVRPISIHSSLTIDYGFRSCIEDAKNIIRSRLKKYPHLYGDTTVLADMSDWNPAEMIGIRPHPLSISLYQYLITDSSWRIARGAMGYHNPFPENLLFCIGGHPYIDVRNSFNNLIPSDLKPELAVKLINHYIERLKKHPHLHDKVEFDVAITCLTPDFNIHAQRLLEDGFSEKEIEELKKGLKIITENAITGKLHSINDLCSKTDSLNPRREKLLSSGYEHTDIPTLIQILLDDCIERGTIPFSILARYGFIASSMLRGLLSKGIISEEMKNNFLNSIETVAGKMVEDMGGVLSGSYSREKFLNKYGHLRPGSYDITSYSYKENPEYYFPEINEKIGEKVITNQSNNEYTFDESVHLAIAKEIDSMGMKITVDQLLTFIKEAIAAREYAKFQFTKNLNEVLILITEWGRNYGFSRFDLTYLFIRDILRINKVSLPEEKTLYLKQKIQEGKDWHRLSHKVETPQMITIPEDLDLILHNVSDPNFVTSKLITAPLYHLKGEVDKSKLEGSIVLTEGADPGYDWIFLHNIKGLITKYGGAASHMTIRCAEFGLPAAIGCGEEWYKRLKNAKNVELNCSNKQIKILL
jgi:choline kinase